MPTGARIATRRDRLEGEDLRAKLSRLASPIVAAGAVALLTASSLQAAPKWVALKTPSFTVVSDGSEGEARRIGAQFETFRALLKDIWPSARFDTPRPVTILAVRFEEGLRRLLPEYWETKGGTRPAGVFFRSPERYWVALRMDVTEFRLSDERWSNPYLIVFHEYIHVIVNLNFKRVPVWLGEGLAEYWGNTAIQDEHVYTGHPILHHLITLGQRPVFPLETLFAVTHGSPEYSEANRANILYAQSWALVHYLHHGSESRVGQLGRFLNLLSGGRSLEEAQKEAFGDLEVLHKELESYLQRLQVLFQYGHRKATITGDAQAFTARRISEAESLAVQAAFHVARNRRTEARALAEEALTLEPDLAAAHEALALLAWREGNTDEASKSIRRATALPDASDFAHYLDGQLRWQQLTGPKGLEEVEASFRKAVELNASFADAYALLARVMDTRGAPLERTLPVATKAVRIEPNNIGYWIAALRLMGRGGYLKEARAKAAELLNQIEGQERAQLELLIAEFAGSEGPSSPGGGPANTSRSTARAEESVRNTEGLRFDPRGADFTEWIKSFKEQVYQNWIVPRAALLGYGGHVGFEFTVERDGSLSALRMLKSSGTSSFDRSARNSLTASRFMALPDDYDEPRVTMQVTFHYNEGPSE